MSFMFNKPAGPETSAVTLPQELSQSSLSRLFQHAPIEVY